MLGMIKGLLITFKWLLITYVAFVGGFIFVLAGLGVGLSFLALVLPVALIVAAAFLVTRLVHTG